MQDESGDVESVPNVPELSIGCWISAPEGVSVVVALDEKLVTYRYSAVPFRDGKFHVLEQNWVLTTAPKGAVKFLYPSNVVSMEVTKLKGPYGREEKKVEPIIIKKLTSEETSWD